MYCTHAKYVPPPSMTSLVFTNYVERLVMVKPMNALHHIKLFFPPEKFLMDPLQLCKFSSVRKEIASEINEYYFLLLWNNNQEREEGCMHWARPSFCTILQPRILLAE